MILRKPILAGIVALAFASSSFAQSIPATQTETRLALQVVFLQGRYPAYQQVSASGSKKSGSWYALFGRLPEWQLPSGSLPISAVKLTSYLEGEVVKLNVSVLRGQFHEVEDHVASYSTRENEVTRVRELAQFGVEPFVIKVVRPALHSDFPDVANKTTSLSVVGLEPIVATLPRYKLTLHNLSEKNSIALSIDTFGDERPQRMVMPQSKYGEPLIKARESASFNQSLGVKAATEPGGFQPLPSSSPRIVIQTVVFEDGTYEGEPNPAGRYLGFVVGRRTELRRIVPLLDQAAKRPVDGSSSEALQSQLASLNFELDETEVKSLMKAFPKMDQKELRSAVEVAMHGVRSDLMDQLKSLEKTGTAFSSWLARTQELYSIWLARLEIVNVPTQKPRP